jgi:hypothetical protein
MQAYRWTPAEIDAQPLDLLLDLAVVLAEKEEETVPVDAIF